MASSRRDAPTRARMKDVWAVRLPVVQRVCRRVAAGETVQDICRDPMMPLRQELHAWLAEEPEFKKMMANARRRSGRAGLAREGRPGVWSEATVQEFLARIGEGRGLVEVCSEPDMPTPTTIYRWLRTRPEFAQAYAEARALQSDVLFDLAWSLARGAREENVAAARLMIQTIKWRCARLAPRRYGTAEAAKIAARAEDDERPIRVRVREFDRDPNDPKKVIEVFPEEPKTFLMERKRR